MKKFPITKQHAIRLLPTQKDIVQRRVEIEWLCDVEENARIEIFLGAWEIGISKEVRRCNVGVLERSYHVIKGVMLLDEVMQHSV